MWTFGTHFRRTHTIHLEPSRKPTQLDGYKVRIDSGIECQRKQKRDLGVRIAPPRRGRNEGSMNLGSKAVLYYALGTVIACFTGVPLAHGQAARPGTEQKPLMAEDVFKNVQLLKGIPVKEFMDTMGFFSAATSLNCIDCHAAQESNESLQGYATDTPLKQTARKMILLVNMINKTTFGGQRKVTCYTCHRATDHPKTIPSLLEQYGTPEDDPDEVEITSNALGQPANQISADQILDKYLQAIGGAPLLAKLTSFVAKGTYEGYETASEKVPLEIFANAPNQLTTVVHTQHGDSVSTYDGNHGWVAAADKLMRTLPLSGGDLQGAKIDAYLSFATGIKRDFKWRTGFPSVSINDRPVQVIQEVGGGETGAKLYFDKDSGLLLRQVRYSDTPVGVIPTQIDYSDYRGVAGVKMPFHTVITWTDGRSTIELTDVQPNVRIDAAKFATPAPPRAKPETP
jgi:photosynthetic reaction center cytochrome c subunit